LLLCLLPARDDRSGNNPGGQEKTEKIGCYLLGHALCSWGDDTDGSLFPKGRGDISRQNYPSTDGLQVKTKAVDFVNQGKI